MEGGNVYSDSLWMRHPASKRATPNLNAHPSHSKVQGGLSKNASYKKRIFPHRRNSKDVSGGKRCAQVPFSLTSFLNKGRDTVHLCPTTQRNCSRRVSTQSYISVFPNQSSPVFPAWSWESGLRAGIPGNWGIPAWKKVISFVQEKFRSGDLGHPTDFLCVITTSDLSVP